MSKFTIKEMLEAGVHYGHNTRRWNPKMKPYIHGVYNNTHILNLAKTAPMFAKALDFIGNVVKGGGKVIFIGTKRNVTVLVEKYAIESNQFFVNHRWYGGLLTNWKTVSKSITNMGIMEEKISDNFEGLTKKEKLQIKRQKDKLERDLKGVRELGNKMPEVAVIIDVKLEKNAVLEAKKLNIPIVGIVDSNSDPDLIDFPIPGNDDSIKAVEFYLSHIAEVIKSNPASVSQAKPVTTIAEKTQKKETKAKDSSESVKTEAKETKAKKDAEVEEKKESTQIDAKDNEPMEKEPEEAKIEEENTKEGSVESLEAKETEESKKETVEIEEEKMVEEETKETVEKEAKE